MPCSFAAARIFRAAVDFAPGSSNSVWLKRAIALRTCASSLIGRWRSPRSSTQANEESFRRLRSSVSRVAMDIPPLRRNRRPAPLASGSNPSGEGCSGVSSGLRCPEPGDFRLDVERHHDAALLVLAPRLAGNPPHDLELVAIRILSVERFRDPVVTRSAERPGITEGPRRIGEILDRRDLPR